MIGDSTCCGHCSNDDLHSKWTCQLHFSMSRRDYTGTYRSSMAASKFLSFGGASNVLFAQEYVTVYTSGIPFGGHFAN